MLWSLNTSPSGMTDSDFSSDSDSAIDSKQFSPIVSVFTDSKFALLFFGVQHNSVLKHHETTFLTYYQTNKDSRY